MKKIIILAQEIQEISNFRRQHIENYRKIQRVPKPPPSPNQTRKNFIFILHFSTMEKII
jgi:hypothetical protein